MIIIGKLTYDFLDKLEHKKINDNKKPMTFKEKFFKILKVKK